MKPPDIAVGDAIMIGFTEEDAREFLGRVASIQIAERALKDAKAAEKRANPMVYMRGDNTGPMLTVIDGGDSES